MFDWHLTKDIYFLNLQSGLNKGDDIVVRERKLLIQVEDLREKMRQQQNNQAVEKQELVPSFFFVHLFSSCSRSGWFTPDDPSNWQSGSAEILSTVVSSHVFGSIF